MTHHEVLVVGAGLGGLVAANVLQRGGRDVVVLDLDASATARHQGGMLDIHEDSGQPALAAAGLLEPFRALTLPGGEAMRILDRAGTVLVDEADEGTGTRPEVERGDLRALLLGGLADGTVRWGTRVVSARPRDLLDGVHEVTLADGSTLTCDLLVGADGTWSRIRPLVSADVPAYTGITAVEVDLLDADARHPRVAAVVGDGILFALGDRIGFLAHREHDAKVHVYAALRVPEDWADSLPFGDPDRAGEVTAATLQWFDGWAPELRALVADADGDAVPRPIHALPVGHRWPRVPGVTLLGDAAHVMSPFAGEGANLAMQDGAELARAVLDHPGDLEAALTAYEAALFPRSAASAQESADNLELCFGPDGAHALVAQMASYQHR